MWSWASLRRPPPLIALLAAARSGTTGIQQAPPEPAIRWAVATGLGPLLSYVMARNAPVTASAIWPLVQGSNLTARLLAAEQTEAMTRIIDACAGRVAPLTLLKGISICEEHYPSPHLRPMRDLDLLVRPADLPTAESLLEDLGYQPRSELPPEFYATHHHSTPLVHPETGIWVEVHRALFPPTSRLGRDKAFDLEHVVSQLRPASFHGRAVTRLSNELQLVYTATHWATDLTVVGGTTAILDVVYLLRNGPIDWADLLGWLEGSHAAVFLYLLVTYLDRHRLVSLAPEILRELETRQRAFGRINLELLHGLIDCHVVGGRPFGRMMSEWKFQILWTTLIDTGPPVRNLLRVPWNLLPARWRRGPPRWLDAMAPTPPPSDQSGRSRVA